MYLRVRQRKITNGSTEKGLLIFQATLWLQHCHKRLEKVQPYLFSVLRTEDKKGQIYRYTGTLAKALDKPVITNNKGMTEREKNRFSSKKCNII